ncbi:hypothetical protein D3C71_1076240 [compost metagenome]
MAAGADRNEAQVTRRAGRGRVGGAYRRLQPLRRRQRRLAADIGLHGVADDQRAVLRSNQIVAVGQAACADHVIACRLARRAAQHASQRVVADQVALRNTPRQRRIPIARALGLVVSRDGDRAAVDDRLMLRVGQHVVAGQTVVAVGQRVAHVGIAVAGVDAVERCRRSHAQGFACDQVGQRSRRRQGRRVAVIDLAGDRGAVHAQHATRNRGARIGSVQHVVAGVAAGQCEGDCLALSGVLIGEIACDAQRVACDDPGNGIRAGDRCRRVAVVDLVQRAQRTIQLACRDRRRGRGVGGDGVVARVRARQRAVDVDPLANGGILVSEGARGRQGNRITRHHAAERARRVGGGRAVIGLAGGRDGARQGLRRDAGLRRGVGAQQVVAGIDARQHAVHRHQLAVADVLVAEQARGVDGHIVALHYAVQCAGRGGVARTVVYLAGGGQRAGDRLRRDRGRGRGVGGNGVVAGVGANQRAVDIDALAHAGVLVGEGTAGRQRDRVAQDHAVERTGGFGDNGAVVRLAGSRDGARQCLGRNAGLRRGVGRQQIVAGVRTRQRAGYRHQFVVSNVLVAKRAQAVKRHVVALHHTGQRAGGGGA